MRRKSILEMVKFVSALTIGVVIGGITRPAVNAFFKLNKNAETDNVPSVDIEEEEIISEECCDE